jgi:ectoine hydroxylase-related dioxygenase (phytanoyl-CoA dioxygenase family)
VTGSVAGGPTIAWAPGPRYGSAMEHGYLSEAHFDLDAFVALADLTTDPSTVPTAVDIVNEIPIYEGADVEAASSDADRIRALETEWARILDEGAGVLAVRRAFSDTAVIDAASEVFGSIIADERAAGTGGGDHYAKPGANDRIWNAHEKLCRRAPDVFVEYYRNATIATGARAWLGPHYQLTAQVNVVNPGGEAQRPHRDYHLGFYSTAEVMEFPLHVHQASATQTLQGAVAHTDMPVETGPTKVYPFSQQYRAGFALSDRNEFAEAFEQHHVQLPLGKGDIVFFNPAVLHAAGTNRTADVRRMNNLLQICSVFTRAMEWRDHDAMCLAVFPALVDSDLGPADIDRLITATADGYAFPTSLDLDPPVAGLAPESQAALMHRAVAERWDLECLASAFEERNRRRPYR